MAVGTALAILGSVAAGAVSSGIQAGAAGDASRAASNAALQSGQLQADAANRATALQGQVYADQRNLSAPSVRLGAGALSRQARMAGLSPEEINQFYNGQVNALNQPFAGAPGGPGSTLSEDELQAAFPALAQEWAGWERAGNSRTNGHRTLYGDFAGYVRSKQGGDALLRPQETQATGAQSTEDYAAQDLGNLDEFAPQQFEFGADELYADPSYQFRRDQGEAALNRRASSAGRYYSPATDQALIDYNQDYASTEYDNAYSRAFNEFQIEDTNKWNRLGALSGAGANATAQLIQGGQNYASGASQTMQNAGNAQAQGVLNAGNARASGYQAQGNAWAGFAGNTVPGAIGFAQGQGWFGKG